MGCGQRARRNERRPSVGKIEPTNEVWLAQMEKWLRDFNEGLAIDDSEELLNEVPDYIEEILRLNGREVSGAPKD